LRGWTQGELAQRAGLSRSTLTLIEQGNRGMDMSIDTAWRLAWAPGTSVDMLIGLPELRG
jgi:transcriptional regulator with XRE-family HTH domain